MLKNNTFTKFLLTSGFAAGVNILARYLLNAYLSYQASVIIAYLIAMSVAFILARVFVFKSNHNVKSQAIKFAIVNGFALLLVWSASLTFSQIIFPWLNFRWHAEDIAHIIGVSLPAVSSFFGHKYFSFRDSLNKPIPGV